MERRFTIDDDFEQSLKEHVDDFKMIPSRKVWHSIYNDIHPGKRWPSITMGFLLIFTIVVVGPLNTRNNSQVHKPEVVAAFHENESSDDLKSKNKISAKPTIVRKRELNNSAPLTTARKQTSIYNGENTTRSNKQNIILTEEDYLLSGNLSNASSIKTKGQIGILSDFSTEQRGGTGIENVTHNENYFIIKQNPYDITGLTSAFINEQTIFSNSDLNISDNTSLLKENSSNIQNLVDKKASVQTTINKKFTKPNDESDKKPLKPKRKKNIKIDWVYFVAPQMNTVRFSGNPIRPIANNVSPSVAINQKDYSILRKPAVGFEAGAQLNYAISKKLKLTSALHFTYSGYNIISNQVHPTVATLMLTDPRTGNIYAKNYLTHYGDGTAQITTMLNNYSFQVSTPLGLQYELKSNDRVTFNVAGDLEPSLVIKGNSYLLSSDAGNYVNDPSLLRKWNMNSNFGIFVTLHSNKFQWQMGPNVRYQWFSTYNKSYTVKEHLINYGLRIGISPLRK